MANLLGAGREGADSAMGREANEADWEMIGRTGFESGLGGEVDVSESVEYAEGRMLCEMERPCRASPGAGSARKGFELADLWSSLSGC